MNLLKYWLALYLRKRLAHNLKQNEITDEQARKWNHLQGLIISKGGVKLRLDLLGWVKSK
jgi:hypothetical protein